MQDIGSLRGFGSAAYDVSSNESVIVGDSDTSSGLRAFRWTAATGMKNLSTLYSVGSGSYLISRPVSADGLRITGYGHNAQTRWHYGYVTK